MNKDEARSAVIGAISIALKEPTLQQGFEAICKNLVELEKENKTISRKANEAIADKLLITAKYNEVLNDLNQENDKLRKENAELKNEHNAFKIYSDGAELDAINLNEQLTKAKEIIKQLLLLPYANNEEVFADVTSILDKAEQFLKDLEK